MKKIMNQADTFVYELCNGIAMTNPDVVSDLKYKVIRKREIDQEKVILISGGGSGHEPAHAGFVGKGMLDAAICGDVFASPTQIQVYKGVSETRSKKGTLLIIKNYSGDIMNFKNGAALAADEGAEVEYVIVNDDIAVKDSLYTVGRRGVAGTVLVHKVAGAAAEMGLDLKGVKEAAQDAVNATKSIGFALSSCTVPAKGEPTFEISDGEMEYGVGIHGEPGIKREAAVSCDEIAGRMTEDLLASLEMDKDTEQELAVLVNGFGGTPLQELYVLANAVRKKLASCPNIQVYRSFVGNYMTSIDMMGASLTFMKLNDTLKKYLDYPSMAPGFRVDGPVSCIPYTDAELAMSEKGKFVTEEEWGKIEKEKISLNNIQYMTAEMGRYIIEKENYFCEIDSFAGDGDFGSSVAKGFKQLQNEWSHLMQEDTIGGFLKACGMIIVEYCGGASGPIWGSAFLGAASQVGAKKEISLKEFADMMQAAVRNIQKTGQRSFGKGAEVGDKTLIDALVPYADTLSSMEKESIAEAFEKATVAAETGAQKTAEIVARMGRAGVVGERSLGHPDAGALALGMIFRHITGKLHS